MQARASPLLAQEHPHGCTATAITLLHNIAVWGPPDSSSVGTCFDNKIYVVSYIVCHKCHGYLRLQGSTPSPLPEKKTTPHNTQRNPPVESPAVCQRRHGYPLNPAQRQGPDQLMRLGTASPPHTPVGNNMGVLQFCGQTGGGGGVEAVSTEGVAARTIVMLLMTQGPASPPRKACGHVDTICVTWVYGAAVHREVKPLCKVKDAFHAALQISQSRTCHSSGCCWLPSDCFLASIMSPIPRSACGRTPTPPSRPNRPQHSLNVVLHPSLPPTPGARKISTQQKHTPATPQGAAGCPLP
jgi:hypothetical protein